MGAITEIKARKLSFANFSTKTKVLIAVAVPLLLTVGIGFVAKTSFSKMSETSGWVAHALTVLEEADSIVSSAVDMETGMRGYLLAGDEQFLAPYKSGGEKAYSALEQLRETVSDNPPQVQRLTEAENVLKQWQSEVAEQQIQLRREIGNSKTMVDLSRQVQKAEGKTYFDAFRKLTTEFIQAEQALLAERSLEFTDLIELGETSADSIRSVVTMVNHTHEVIAEAQRILSAAVDMETGMRGFLLAGDPTFLAPYERGQESFATRVKGLSETVSDNPAQVARLTEIEKVISDWRTSVVEPMLDLRRSIGNSATMDDMARLVGEAHGKLFFDQFRDTMAEFMSIEDALKKQREQSNIETSANTETMILGAVGAAILLGSIFALLIGSSIGSAIKTVTQAMSRVAEGDTSVEIKGQSRGDEVGAMARSLDVFRKALVREKELEEAQKVRDAQQAEVVRELSGRLSDLAKGDLTVQIQCSFPEDYEQLRRDFNSTVSTLSATVTEVIEISKNIRNGATEISQSSDDLSNRTESQAATLEETAAAIDELTASVKSSADGARSVENIMGEARTEAENSGEVVQSAVAAMTEIEVSSSHIAQIISVIDDIAFQTNLLALNAGVEAARAGEAGRGFAVVASEVRGLAQRSAEAATEIKALITDSRSQVTRGVDLVGKAGEALTGIVERVNHISKLVTDIALGAVEQSTALGEINTGVVQLDKVTQQNAGMVEEATAASHMLKSDATNLAERVAHFKITGGAKITPMQQFHASKPTADGDDDWDLGGIVAEPIAANANGNAALDKWHDF
ncbi:CHASE3 domain-containing protein [Puniceibacterium sediminis]|uniref:Methyl-accepting chemotaxis protein n=1 Tax=Puniceibacterium sediminis TaxID=1608407 RepID=A0A238ZRJ9_9RHOB|nr:CHASE3 domain-containing protein [Puniceibacterium sediminis]SNR85819.1 Methyl-accepting chemotaxis protein [Puniceibacterium sediminis]